MYINTEINASISIYLVLVLVGNYCVQYLLHSTCQLSKPLTTDNLTTPRGQWTIDNDAPDNRKRGIKKPTRDTPKRATPNTFYS